jgi:cell cycle checkpoint protein
MAPPLKRRKRNIIVSSPPSSNNEIDQDEDNRGLREQSTAQLSNLASSPIEDSSPFIRPTTVKAQITPTKPKPKAKNSNSSNTAPLFLPSRGTAKPGLKSASSSPEKRKPKAKDVDKVKSGNIYTFFSTQVQKQQNGGGTTARTSGSQPSLSSKQDKGEIEIISDDDDEIKDSKAQKSSIFAATAKKRSLNAMTGSHDVVSGSQKFLRPMTSNSATTTGKEQEDMRPWAERFAPVDLNELAVHKRKVSDVRGWLEAVMSGQMRQRVLILKGVAGTGKTTTVQLLAKDMGAEVLEWRNPSASIASADGFISIAAQFEEFMGRGGRFGQLDIFSESESAPSNLDPKPLDRRKSIILVEEFPNTFTRSSSALLGFRSAILQYLAANTPSLSDMYRKQSSTEPITPVVMVISETLLTTTTASADSFTAHRLLGPEILQHPGVTVIEFNAIAPTLLAKALELVVQKESRKSGRRKTPGPQVIKRLGEMGDVRSAIGSLEFLCLRGDSDDWGSKVTFGKTKKAVKDSIGLTPMEQESLELVTRREASLGIFHAVGRVVYNKRHEKPVVRPGERDVEDLPDYMSQHSRPRRSEVSIDALIDETGTDTSTFIAALHENFLLSCEASSTSSEFSDLDHVNGCFDSLSDADLLCPSWDGSLNRTSFGSGTSGRGAGGDVMRQDELAFQVAVRGILFSLPYPVKRQSYPGRGERKASAADAYKMFYPTSLRLWRQQDEIESLLDLSATRLLRGEAARSASQSITSGAAAFAKPKPPSVESWERRSSTQSKTNSALSSKPTPILPMLPTTLSSRSTLLLERLPYTVMIAKSRSPHHTTTLLPLPLRQLEKITKFTGIPGPSEEVSDDDDDAQIPGDEWATDRPAGGETGKRKKKWKEGIVNTALEVRFAGLVTKEVGTTVLSDDDIED